MNLESFKKHIKTVDHKTLDSYHAEISEKLAKARNPQIRLGYAVALDELCIESNLRKSPLTKNEQNVSDDDLLAALNV